MLDGERVQTRALGAHPALHCCLCQFLQLHGHLYSRVLASGLNGLDFATKIDMHTHTHTNITQTLETNIKHIYKYTRRTQAPKYTRDQRAPDTFARQSHTYTYTHSLSPFLSLSHTLCAGLTMQDAGFMHLGPG